jgi:hypothetical protein
MKLLSIIIGVTSFINKVCMREMNVFNYYSNKFEWFFDTDEEALNRENIFYDNLEFINQFNEDSDNLKLGINKFSIFTNEEFKVKKKVEYSNNCEKLFNVELNVV